MYGSSESSVRAFKSGEVRINDLRDGGEPEGLREFFFFIDNGSTPRDLLGFGVASVFPIGSKGTRLLRGNGVVEIIGSSRNVTPGGSLPSVYVKSRGGRAGVIARPRDGSGGRGDGLRGPKGRRSAIP
jgi:hypothetical protein